MPRSKRRLTSNGNYVPCSIWTKHAGIWMRSRLEASWAEFFDAAGMPWSYEPMRFTLGNALQYSYLPDFWLPEKSAYAEVKPVFPSLEEMNLVNLLASWTRLSVFFLIGKPWQTEIHEVFHNGRHLNWQRVSLKQFLNTSLPVNGAATGA